MSETTPEYEPFHLRDRLLATLTEYHVVEPMQAVEAVCDQFTSYLRAQATDWHRLAAADGDMIYGKAAAMMCQGLADGIEAGRPPADVSPQDLGVQSES